MLAADAVSLLEAVDLACLRGGRLLLEAVSWRLGPGDALLLKGANGSGKSSLLRLLAGFLRPAGGRLLHEGRNAFEDLPRYRASLHHLGYQDGLKPALTVAENLESTAALLGGGGDPGRPVSGELDGSSAIRSSAPANQGARDDHRWCSPGFDNARLRRLQGTRAGVVKERADQIGRAHV